MTRCGMAIVMAMLGFLAPGGHERPAPPADRLAGVDHLVYAGPDLDRAIEKIQKLIGVRASQGGQHPGRGTRNALAALGPDRYLEVIGPDPDQATFERPRPFGIDTLTEPKLAAWAAKGADLPRLASRAHDHGVALGEVMPGSRRRPDGVLLSWQYTNPRVAVADGIVPFFIDWGQSPHPARSAATGATLVELRAEHPDARRVQEMLRHLELDIRVQTGAKPALIAVIDGPNGRIELR